MALDLNTMHLTFDDEFNSLSLYNGVSGTWDPTYGFGGLNNFASRIHGDEKQIYVDPSFTGSTSSALGANPFSIHDGILDITAAPTSPALADALEGYQYTSGLITTRESFQQTYGYFEMRAELPQGQGLWPAFWLMPANGGWPPELDVVEMLGNNPSTIYTTAHFNGPTGPAQSAFGSNVADTSSGFHTYGVDWEPDQITWYFDGKQVAQTATPADMHSPMYLLANLAVGGSWPGSPDATTPFPANMQIDYIRAYASGPGQSVVGGATASGETMSTATAGVTGVPDANHPTSGVSSSSSTTASAMPDTNLASGSGTAQTGSGSTAGATATPDTNLASESHAASAGSGAAATSGGNVASSGTDTSPTGSGSEADAGVSSGSDGVGSSQHSTGVSQAGQDTSSGPTLTEQSDTTTAASHHDTAHSVLGMAAIAPLVDDFQHGFASSHGEGSATAAEHVSSNLHHTLASIMPLVEQFLGSNSAEDHMSQHQTRVMYHELAKAIALLQEHDGHTGDTGGGPHDHSSLCQDHHAGIWHWS